MCITRFFFILPDFYFCFAPKKTLSLWDFSNNYLMICFISYSHNDWVDSKK